jgi:hypothetical protein
MNVVLIGSEDNIIGRKQSTLQEDIQENARSGVLIL